MDIDMEIVISLLTFIGIVTIAYNTNKLNKTTKYIERITFEWINWIKELREDISEVVTFLDSLI